MGRLPRGKQLPEVKEAVVKPKPVVKKGNNSK